MKRRPVIVIGAGGHAKVLIDTLRRQHFELIGATDIAPQKVGNVAASVPVIGNDDAVCNYLSKEVWLVNGIGSIDVPNLRLQVFTRFKNLGYTFTDVIHPSAILAEDVTFGEGVQIMAGAIVQSSCQIGSNSIVNTGASIDHECHVGAHVHIAPGATLSGGVTIGDCSHIGTGAIIIQGVHVGRNALVGAGAVVLKNVADNSKAVGVPAREA
jgi:sugar O-acyltransferase (sialic acid O-acetyltransferase NeuD family)